MNPGRRILVAGQSGSGKTTLGRALAERLGLPFIELDSVVHVRPNWEDLTGDELRAEVSGLLVTNPGGWVIDGNYSVTRELTLPLADTVAWLCLPFRVVYPRLVRRTFLRSARGEELWGGNRETWRQTLFSRESMLLWGVKSWHAMPRKLEADLDRIPHDARVVELRSPAEVRRFLASVSAPGP